MISLADTAVLWDRKDGLTFATPSGKIEILSEVLSTSGLDSLAPYQPPAPLAKDEFRLLFGRAAVHTHAQTMNNPLLHELRAVNPLWIHPERAAALELADGDSVDIIRGPVSARAIVRLTPMIHPEAVFLLHGFGRTVPAQTRACGQGVADQRLQVGLRDVFDPVGGGSAMTEAIVRVRKRASADAAAPSRAAGGRQ